MQHRPSIKRVLAMWAAGYHLLRGVKDIAQRLFDVALPLVLEHEVAKAFGEGTEHDYALALGRDFPLTEADVQRIDVEREAPEALAAELIARFSPKWFLGWRDITNSTNERTLITSAVPRTAVGNNFPLLFMGGISSLHRLCFAPTADSFVVDYVTRQKVGGTHINYFYLKQFPMPSPEILDQASPPGLNVTMLDWCVPRILELVFTAHDMAPLGRDCGYSGPPFAWDPERRFEIRSELDAAFFHLYLPPTPDGRWRPARVADGAVVDETDAELAALKRHFPTPRDAVAYVLDQFPILRDKDEAAHGRYRTKERILEIYDAMHAAQRTQRPYESPLSFGDFQERS